MKTTFLPIRGTESDIKQLTPIDGAVYFAYDTKKIFYGHKSDEDPEIINLIPMGGNSGVYYGNKRNIAEGSSGVTFRVSDIEMEDSSISLNIHDLILNIPNGIFYRVISSGNDIEGFYYECEKLTVAGTGGGGGSGGAAGQDYVVVKKDPNDKIINKSNNVLMGADYNISFLAYAYDSHNDPIVDEEVTIIVVRVGTSNKDDSVILASLDEKNSFTQQGIFNSDNNTTLQVVNIKSLCDQIPNKRTEYFKIYCFYQNGRIPVYDVLTYQLNLVPIKGRWDESVKLIQQDSSISYNLNYEVQGSGLYSFAKLYLDDVLIYTTTKALISGDYWSEISQTVPSSAFTNYKHGLYTIKLELYGSISDAISAENIKFAEFEKSILLYDLNQHSYIIGTSLTNFNLQQYETIKIPILIYGDANPIDGTSIYYRVDDGEEIPINNVKNAEWIYITYNPLTGGEHLLTFTIPSSDSNTGNSLALTFQVEELQMNTLGQEVSDYLFKFLPSSFPTQQALMNYTLPNEEKIKFNNFDWINGGIQKDNDDIYYLKIKAGSSIEFPYKLFETISSAGKSFKLIFKVTFCENYNANFATFNNENNVSNYISFGAQNLKYKIGNILNTVEYLEDYKIDLEFEIYHHEKGYAVQTWVDGCPYKINTPVTGDLTIDKTFIIGSEECDVDFYLFRAYNRSLTDVEHLRNFIVDGLKASTIYERYLRNNVLTDLKDIRSISIPKLLEANPGCKVHVYEIDRMSKVKADTVTNCIYKQYTKDYPQLDEPYIRHNNCNIKVQGTSSEGYVIAAANLDSDFKNGNFIYADGTESDVYKLSNSSIGVKYINTKVNVASAENANNALNQQWYNDHTPYKSVARLQDTDDSIVKHRDTMEFTNGLLFLIDKNPTENFHHAPEDTETYAEELYNNVFKDYEDYMDKIKQNRYEEVEPQFYAICNVGNSKKNTEVFHRNDELCMEVKANDTTYQIMSELCPESWIEDRMSKTPKGNFEFRFPDHDKSTVQQYTYWRDFTKWMVENNPILATNNYLPRPIDPNDRLYSLENEENSKNNELFTDDSQINEGWIFPRFSFSPEKSPWLASLNITVTNYTGPYIKDTIEYRVAKMLYDCENHLAMDSFIYHYLFIEYHTMIDNVAKNTFWSSNSDSGYQIWDICKDYDNDTADGIDNDGKPTISYGYECLDKQIDDPTSYRFNAANGSSWLNFIGRLSEVLEAAAQDLNNKKWHEGYLETFDNWQNMIPEICWILDCWRKYKRPYEVYGNGSYLERLAGGKKIYQRRQFEKFQQTYLNTKYKIGESGRTGIPMRINPKQLSTELPVKLYQKCYLRYYNEDSDISNNTRVTDTNQIYYLTIPAAENSTEYLFYIKHPELYTQIGDDNQFTVNGHTYSGSLGSIFPRQINFSTGTKLSKIVLNNQYDYLLNSNQNNKIYEEIIFLDPKNDFNKEQIVKEIIAQHMDKPNNKELQIQIQYLNRLKKIDYSNSEINSIILRNNAITESITINSPTTLVLPNLTRLNEMHYDNLNNLQYLDCRNIDLKNLNLSYTLLNDAINLSSIYLENINWNLNSSITFRGNNLIDNLNFTVLDYLLNQNGNVGLRYQRNDDNDYTFKIIDQSNAISGNIIIDDTLVDDNNSLNLYEKYILGIGLTNSIGLPKLNLIFTSDNAKLYNIKVFNGNQSVLWERKAYKNTVLNNAFFSNGLGVYNLSNINKDPDLDYTYEFQYWEIKDENNNIIESQYTNNPNDYCLQYNGSKNLTTDLYFYPVFKGNKRKYDVIVTTLGRNGEQLWEERFEGENGFYRETKVSDIIDSLTKIPYRPDNFTNILQFYHWNGLSLSNEATAEPLNNNFIIGTVNRHFYATFEEKNVFDQGVALDTKYFIFSSSQIYPNKKYSFGGKLVVPTNFGEGRQVNQIYPYAFNKNGPIYDSSYVEQLDNITHIFFEPIFNGNEKNYSINIIGAESCCDLPNLKYFDFGQGLSNFNSNSYSLTVNESAFSGLKSLTNNTFNFINIGNYAFSEAFDPGITSITFIKTPTFGFGAMIDNNIKDSITFKNIGLLLKRTDNGYIWNNDIGESQYQVFYSEGQPTVIQTLTLDTSYILDTANTSWNDIETKIENYLGISGNWIEKQE